MRLSVIIVHYGEPEPFLQLARQLPAELHGYDSEVLVVDNGPDFGRIARELSGLLPAARVLTNDRNAGFGAGVNQAAAQATGDALAILNPDVELRPGFFKPLVDRVLDDPSVGAAGPAVFRPEGTRQLTGHRRFPTLGTIFIEYCLPLQVLLSRWLSVLHPHDESERRHRTSHRTAHLTGVCLVTRRDVFLTDGGFDERYFLYLEETDWQRRLAERGLTTWYCAETACTHYGSIGKRFAQGTDQYLTSLFRYWRKWSGPWSLGALRMVIGLASVISLVSLIPGLAVLLIRPALKRKLRLYSGAFAFILGWILRPHRHL